MKKQFKYVGEKYLGDTEVKVGEAKLRVKPGDIVEIDTDKLVITNITSGMVGRQRNKDMILGNKELRIKGLIERWEISQHWEEVKPNEPSKKPTEKVEKKK